MADGGQKANGAVDDNQPARSQSGPVPSRPTDSQLLAWINGQTRRYRPPEFAMEAKEIVDVVSTNSLDYPLTVTARMYMVYGDGGEVKPGDYWGEFHYQVNPRTGAIRSR